MIECRGRKLFGKPTLTAQQRAAWARKNCAPREAMRQFDAGGPEAGTLSGARRAPGLFDSGWGEAFPLTRAEQKAVQEGAALTDAFFQPPTEPHPSNWIEDHLKRLRGRFDAAQFTTPKALIGACPEGGFGMSCSGPNATVTWFKTSGPFTESEKAQYRDAYCKPGVCITGPVGSPPPGVKQTVYRYSPRNPAVAVKASCRPEPPTPVVTDRPLDPLAPPPPSPPPPTGPVACVSDIILGRDDGQFASGWFRVIRNGRPTLTPAPIICEDL